MARVIARDRDGQSMGSGTLVHVTQQYGVVLTNWHVVRGAPGTVEVVFPNGARYQATVMKTDKTWDLAALAIWRPDVKPVTIAGQPPQPGEPLTIAGYGSGNYREATGRFMQFVAPSQKHAFEMVELSAEARQGDSGGPILNARGQLTGVLLGAGHGATIGSYCGRVEIFLADVTPLLDAPTESIATTAEPPPPPKALAATDHRAVAEATPPNPTVRRASPGEFDVAKREPIHDLQNVPPNVPPAEAAIEPRVEQPDEPALLASVEPPAPHTTGEPDVDFYRPAFVSPGPRHDSLTAFSAVPPRQVDAQVVRLTDVIGETTGEQIKSLLAAIGALALLISSVRIVGGPKK